MLSERLALWLELRLPDMLRDALPLPDMLRLALPLRLPERLWLTLALPRCSPLRAAALSRAAWARFSFSFSSAIRCFARSTEARAPAAGGGRGPGAWPFDVPPSFLLSSPGAGA
jgi:hypothetical protein